MTLAEVRPFGDRLIVRPDAKIETTDGGLVIPEVVLSDNPNYFYMTGVVLKLGDGVRDDTCACQNRQCARVERRRVNGRCSQCGATQALVSSGERVPFDFAVGDRVLFNRFAGKQIEVADAIPIYENPLCQYTHGGVKPTVTEGQIRKVLILREIEVLGKVDGDHRVLPGYEAPAWAKPTSNPGDKRPGA